MNEGTCRISSPALTSPPGQSTRRIRPKSIGISCLAARLLFLGPLLCHGQELPVQGVDATSKRGMVVSVSRHASEVGRNILDVGGNAVDATVAVGFALAVTWPEAGNIGGGGFMLVHPADGTHPTFFDYRERAPAAATPTMFAAGTHSPYRLVGVPGTVRGLANAHQKYGRLPWANVVQPAVKLARHGFEVNDSLAASLNGVLNESPGNHELQRVFGKPGGGQWKPGDHLTQPELAETLSRIATDGHDAFYVGAIADAIETEMTRGGGLITKDDLKAYQPRQRTPVHGTYRGYDIFSAPPPSSGGTALIEMLNLVEEFELRHKGRWSTQTIHVMIESMRRAYCDRARYLGDPDFVSIPAYLISKQYAAKLREGISLTEATTSAELGSDIVTQEEPAHTTHFSVIDQDGMAVANTYTLEDDFGSRIVVRGAGFLLNNEMGDFNPKPGVTNDQGQIGTKPNQAAPGKRMLSSMTPTIVSREGQVYLITGSPGGRTIINTVFCMLLNVLEFEMPLRDAVNSPRLHHQWMPDIVRIEQQLLNENPDLVKRLQDLGHAIDANARQQGDAHSILVTPARQRIGAVDSRRGGWVAGQE